MMDIKFIINFLNKNYRVVIGAETILISEKDTTKKYTFNEFMKNHFNVVFTNYKINDEMTSNDVVIKWFTDKKTKITQDLFDYISSIDDKIGATKMLKMTLHKFKRKKEYNKDFLVAYFHSHYNEYNLKPRLLEYIKNYGEFINCHDFSKNFDEQLSLDTIKQEFYAKEFLDKWYCKTIVGEKVDELFSQFVITMGPRNWVVTWIGHGQLTREKLMFNFINEPEIVKQFIENAYDKWYEEATITASERYINSNSGFLLA